MTTMRRPRTSARAHRAAAVAVAALLQVTTLLGIAGAEEASAGETRPTISGQPLLGLSVARSPVGGGYGDGDDKHNKDHDDKREDRDDKREDRDDDSHDRRDDIVPTVGQLTSDGVACTATVINSDSELLALTAAHCVYNPEQGELRFKDIEPGWYEDVEFIPGRQGDEAPYGTWRVDRMWTHPLWREDGEARYDIAVVRLAKLKGKNIEDVVGAQGIDFRAADHGEVVTLGYPGVGRFDGTTQERCEADEIEAKGAFYAMRCSDNQGRSGGPWFVDFDEKKGLGSIAAVSSFEFKDRNRLVGVAPGKFVRDLIDAADRNDTKNSNDADDSR